MDGDTCVTTAVSSAVFTMFVQRLLVLRPAVRACLLRAASQKSGTTTKTGTERKLPDTHEPNSPIGMLDRKPKRESGLETQPATTPFPKFEDNTNPETGEVGGPSGPEPTRFGDWERKGRVTDF